MKIGQYCQQQRCRHVELKQFWQAFASRGFVSDSWAFLYYTCQWSKSRNILHTSSTKVIQNDQLSCLSYLVQRFITFSVSVSCARPIPPVDARYVSDSWLSCLVPLLEFNDDAEDIYGDDISILFRFTHFYNIVVRLSSAVTGVALPSCSKSLLVSCYVDL